MSLQRERRVALEMASDAARRMALAEVRYFRCAVRHSRTSRERTRRRREYWRFLAIAYADDLGYDAADLYQLGLGALAVDMLVATAEAMAEGRHRYCRDRGLDPMLPHLIDMAIETVPGNERVELN